MKKKRYFWIVAMNVVVAIVGFLLYFNTKKRTGELPVDNVNENIDIKGLKLMTPAQDMEDLLSSDYVSMEGFGCILYENKQEPIQLIVGGYPDVLDDYKLIEVATASPKYSFYGISVGDDLRAAEEILEDYGFSQSEPAQYKAGNLFFILKADRGHRIQEIRIKLEPTNKKGVSF